MSTRPERWYGVRCVFRHRGLEDGTDRVYEERVTVWTAERFDDAIARAETEAREYAADVGAKYLGLAQAYQSDDVPGDGAEVFSLMRTSRLKSGRYLDTFFDTGAERQGSLRAHEGFAEGAR
ncbi:DUF4288 domain-containing protein [Cellulosimicrobium marinum]|uniref:DUF4288 domain-containing protein n=1 Tax=Cellulosimicrobium marinum TaxID=1638992 RepID=UPI001E47A534|nr:DUF4288 domain-containing protein [Cellulosimicrobium marinum]MCB7136333.1 DUF4288 domain-containing protein [Cellulosimicrobium marinum]